MIRRLDSYLLKAFFRSLFVVTIAIGLTIIVINIVEELRDFIDHQVPIMTILEYYVYWGGWVLKSFFPMFVLIAVLFSVSMLARRNEILAMKASGLSLYRIALPFLTVAMLLSLGHFYYNEFLFPPANKRRLEIKEYTIEQRSRRKHTDISNVYQQIKPGDFYHISRFNIDRKEGKSISVYRTQNDRVNEIITGKRVVYRNHKWVALDVTIRRFEDTVSVPHQVLDEYVLEDITDKPEDLSKPIGKPGDLGLEELTRRIAMMKRNGQPTIREEVDLGIKFAFPAATFIVVLLSIPFASAPGRGGIAVSISGGLLTSLAYFVLFRVTQSAGYNDKIPEFVAIWGVNSLFLLGGIIAMLKARK